LDLKYKVNGDLLLLIKEDLPYSEREEMGKGEKGSQTNIATNQSQKTPRVCLKTQPQLDEYLKVFHCVFDEYLIKHKRREFYLRMSSIHELGSKRVVHHLKRSL